MESSKRIFVVFSTILFLEASTFDPHPHQLKGQSDNHWSPSPALHSNSGLSFGSQHSGGLGIGLDHQNKNLGSNSNSFKTVHGVNSDLNRQHGSGVTGEHDSSHFGGSIDKHSSGNSGLHSQHGTNFNAGHEYQHGLHNIGGSNTGLITTQKLLNNGLNRQQGSDSIGSLTGKHDSSNSGLHSPYESILNAGHEHGHQQHGLHNIGGSNTGFQTTQNSLNNKHESGLNSGSGIGIKYGFGQNGINNKYGTASNFGIDSKYGYGSVLNTGLNLGSTVNSDTNKATSGGSKNAYGSYPTNLNSAYGSNLNHDKFRSIYSLSNDAKSLSPPLLSTKTDGVQNYNSFISNPTTTGFHSSQHHHEDSGTLGDDKVNIVDVPIKSGFYQSISLPLDGHSKYKILHMNPSKNKIPDNVLSTLKEANTDIHKVLDINDGYSTGSYQSNLPQVTAPSGYGIGTVGYSDKNEDKSSLGSYNYGFKKNLPSKVYSALTKAELEIDKVLDESDNQKYTVLALGGSQYDGVNNNGYDNLHNYQTYTTSDPQAQAGATSDTVLQDENKNYNTNYNKDTNTNNLVSSLTLPKLEIDQGLGENGEVTEKQQGFSQSNSDDFSNTLINQPYGNSQETSQSYSNAQASANSAVRKQEGLNEYDAYSNKRIISNKEIDSLTLADIEIRAVLDAVEGGKIKDNQQSVQNTNFAFSNAPPSATANQYGQLSSYNNGLYYPGANTLQTYNQPFGYGLLPPLTSSGNSQASATSGSTTQSGYYPQSSHHYPNYSPSKPTGVAGINEPHESYPQYNAPHLNFTHNYPNRYNNFNHYNHHRNHPNYTSLNWQNYLNQPTSIQTNYGLNYPIRHAPPSNIAIGTQQSSTDITKSAASSNSESTSSISKFDYGLPNYNLYPDHHSNKDIHHRYPTIYGQNYEQQPNINQSPTTDSPVDENAVQTDKSTIIGDVQDSTTETIRYDRWNNIITDDSLININYDTQQSPSGDTNKGIYDYGNRETEKTEITATADATVSSSQAITTSVQQTDDNQAFYGQNYGDKSYIIQSTASPIDTATSNTIGSKNGPDYTSTTNQINSNQESNNIINKIYNTYDSSTQMQSSTDNTNDYSLYGGKNHKYSGVYGENFNIQTTDSSVNEYTVQNYPTSTGTYESSSPTNNLPSSLDNDSTQTQFPIDNTSYRTQELTDYRSEQDKTFDKTTITKIEDLSITDDDSQSGNKRHGGKHHHRHRGQHPKPHDQKWHKNTHPNYSLDKYEISLDQSSYVKGYESTESKSETNNETYQSTENVSPSNTGDVSQTSFTNTGNDKTYWIDYSSDQNVASSKEQSTKTTDSKSEASVLINTNNDYSTITDDNIYNQQTSSTYNNDGSSSTNNQPIYTNNYGNDKQTISIYADYDSDKTQKTTDANYDTYDYSEITKKSEQSVQTDQTEEIKTSKNVKYSEIDLAELTEEDSSSSSTVIQEQGSATKKQGQSSTACGSKGPGFAKIGTTINTKPDGTPYSRAFEALLKILDSLEKIFLSQGSLE